MGPAAQIILSLVIILLVAGLSYLLVISILKESRRYKEERKLRLDGVFSQAEMASYIASYITRINAPFTLIYIDIDAFLEVGEAFGEDQSYKTLELIAKRIRKAIPNNAKIGRVTSDSFIVNLGKDFDRLQVLNLAKKIQESISEIITIFEEAEILLTASIGIVFYPIHGDSYKELMKSLRILNYNIKSSGGNAIRIYSEEKKSDDLMSHMDYYYQIRTAIEQKQFQLYYQPIIDTALNKVYAFESFLRWNHPEHGILAPARFLNILEQSGDIYWVGLWGLETLIQAYFDFAKIYPDVIVSFNISPRQLLNPNIIKDFTKILKKYRINPKLIILEINEYLQYENQADLVFNLQKLKELGFSISIDGYGYDFNKLIKLVEKMVNYIKLGRDFLMEDDSFAKQKFIEAIRDVQTEFKTRIIAEGIGDEDLLKKAQFYHINLKQGYYFHKPMTKQETEIYLSSIQVEQLSASTKEVDTRPEDEK